MSNSPWEIDQNFAKCILDEEHLLLVGRVEGKITMKVIDKDGRILYTKYLTDKQLGLMK